MQVLSFAPYELHSAIGQNLWCTSSWSSLHNAGAILSTSRGFWCTSTLLCSLDPKKTAKTSACCVKEINWYGNTRFYSIAFDPVYFLCLSALIIKKNPSHSVYKPPKCLLLTLSSKKSSIKPSFLWLVAFALPSEIKTKLWCHFKIQF